MVRMTKKQLIIGVGGRVRSGKDTLAELLMEDGFFGVSFGDIVREFARERHVDKPDPISVANMTETSNWLRETRGADVVLQEALEQYKQASKSKDYKGLVLFSVRAPVEVNWILAQGGQLVWVEASDETRYARDVSSRREGEAEVTFEEYKRQEDLQWKPQAKAGVSTEAQMDLSYVKDHATIVIENNGNSLEAFRAEVEVALKPYL